MDLLDLRNNAGTSGISSSAVSSSVSTSQTNSPSPLRFKFTRSRELIVNCIKLKKK